MEKKYNINNFYVGELYLSYQFGNLLIPENSVKHNRLMRNNFKKCNYYNVKNAIAALYIIIRIYYRKLIDKETDPYPMSKIFKMESINNGSRFSIINL